jgi:hypothetical protein
MGIVKIVRRTDAHVVDGVCRAFATPLFEESIKPLDLGEERCIREVTVHHPHGVVGITRCDQPVASIPNGGKMPRGNESTRPQKCKIRHAASYHAGRRFSK